MNRYRAPVGSGLGVGIIVAAWIVMAVRHRLVRREQIAPLSMRA